MQEAAHEKQTKTRRYDGFVSISSNSLNHYTIKIVTLCKIFNAFLTFSYSRVLYTMCCHNTYSVECKNKFIIINEKGNYLKSSFFSPCSRNNSFLIVRSSQQKAVQKIKYNVPIFHDHKRNDSPKCFFLK